MTKLTTWVALLTVPLGIGGAVAAFGSTSVGASAIGVVKDVFGWLLDPAWLIDFGLTVLGEMFKLVGTLMPGDVGTQFDNMGDTLGALPISKMVGVAGYLISPIIDPALFLGCLTIFMGVWLVCMVIRVIILVKNHIWSAGS